MINDVILKDINFTDFGTYLGLIKKKQTNKSSKDAKKSSNNLKIIHTNICGLFSFSYFNDIFYLIHWWPYWIYISLSSLWKEWGTWCLYSLYNRSREIIGQENKDLIKVGSIIVGT